MDSPQLHAVGFDAPSLDSLIAAAFDAGVRGINTAPGFALIGAYSDPSGARMAFLQRTGQQATTTAALVSDTPFRAQVVRFTDLLAKVALYAPDGEGRLLAEFLSLVDDPVAYPQYELTGSESTVVPALGVAALAIDVEAFSDEATFLVSPAAELGGAAMTAATLLSPGLYALRADAIGPGEASPTLLMAGTVVAVETRRNALTGVDFQVARLRSAVELTVAIPAEHPVAPGSVVYGTWFATCSAGTWDRTA